MNCPLCIETMLQPHHRAGMEIDVCPTCKGIWLDRGELEGLIGDSGTGGPRTERQRPQLERERDTERSGRDDAPSKATSKKRKKSWGERLGDALEDVLDL